MTYRQILNKVKAVLEDNNVIKQIMEKYDKQSETKNEHKANVESRIKELCKVAEVDYKMYLQALSTSKTGHSIVQRRDLDEIYINSYNIEWIRAWNGNMDIQVVLDYFVVITYVTDYYAKDDTGTLEVIKAALEQTNKQDLKEKMRTITQVFLTHRQMGEAEAVYRLLPSMTLKKSNVQCQWVSLGVKEERSSRWLKANQDDIESGRPVTEITGHEGLWYELQDMWNKYLRRSVEIEEMCFAQFAKMYQTVSRSKLVNDENSENEDEKYEDQEDYNIELANEEIQEEEIFHYIMTYRSEKQLKDCKNKLPMNIALTQCYPRESRAMQTIL